MNRSKYFDALTLAVAGGQTIKAAAGVAGCKITTAYAVSASPDFRQRVAELRSEITSQAVGRLSNAASQAVDTLVELLDAANDPSIRLNASKAILAALPSMSDFAELRQRIDAIESRSGLKVVAQ